MKITPAYKLFNGKHMSQYECDAYNNLSEEIDWKEKAGQDVEFLKDLRHKMIMKGSEETGFNRSFFA